MTELAIIENTMMTPDEVVQGVRDRARAVYNIIIDANAYQEFSEGKRYLQVEAWQVIGEFDKVKAQTEWVRAVVEDGEVVAYEAKVNLISKIDGSIQGGAQMSCGMDEFVARGKEGWAKRTAVQSMAQTRAESKAYRMNYSAVALLAGFEATPAEEMQSEGAPAPRKRGQPAQQTEFFCLEHETNWFKRGKMRGYAHPIKDASGNDTGQWCNIPEDEDGPVIEPMSPQGPQQAPAAQRAEAEPTATPDEGELPPLAHPGDLMEAIRRRWPGQTLEQVCEALKTENLTVLPSLPDAYRQLVKLWGDVLVI